MNQRTTSRRAFLKSGGVALAAIALPSFLRAAPEGGKRKKLLYFTKSSGFEHSVVARKGDELSHSERIFVELGKKKGFDVTPSKDGRIFDEDLDRFDAFAFYTSGDLTRPGNKDGSPPMSEKGKRALLDAVRGGKGFLGIHAASDSFHTPGDRFQNQEKKDPYIAMLGGEFIRHGKQQKATMTVCDSEFPGCEKLGKSFVLHEEWYALKNFAPDLHVVLVNETEGMEGKDYQRPPFPATWARQHGKGRVFFTSMGHREDVWTNPLFQSVLLGSVAWAFRDVDVDIEPNIDKVTPKAHILGPK